MGVGVYESNFHGRGGTFLVDGPLATDEDYAAYTKECAADDGETLSREEWGRQEYDDENELLLDTVTFAAGRIGFSAASRQRFRSASAPFDREFSLLADDGLVAIGWRSWQTDFVVGAGPTARAERMLGCDAAEAAAELGRSVEGFKTDYDALVAATLECARLELAENGMGCRYRTGGYTTAAYPAATDPKGRLAELKETVTGLRARLSASREETLTLISDEERIAVIAAAAAASQDVAFPVANRQDGGINLYSGADPDGEGCELVASMVVPPELREFFDSLAKDAFVAVPREPRTEAWFRARQTSPREFNLIASAEEIAVATGEDVSVRVGLSDDDPDLTTQVVMASASAPAPGMR